MCSPSSLEISSFEKQRPGITPFCFNQNIEQKAPEKNIPSTTANATSLSAKESEEFIHFIAHLAFYPIDGIDSTALKRVLRYS